MQETAERVAPIAPNLITDEDPPRLIGGVEKRTGRVVFPCPEGDSHEPLVLGREGKVWSWTVQRFRPKSPPYQGPEVFEPFIYAYVELPEVIVAARMTGVTPEAMRTGMAVRFAPTIFVTASGERKLVPAFQPEERA